MYFKFYASSFVFPPLNELSFASNTHKMALKLNSPNLHAKKAHLKSNSQSIKPLKKLHTTSDLLSVILIVIFIKKKIVNKYLRVKSNTRKVF